MMSGYLFILVSICFAISISLMLWWMGKTRRAARLEREEAEKLAADLKKRLDAQEQLVGNLTRMYNEALEYDKNKTEFFSNITHELKTPLSVILGAIQLIEQKIQLSGMESAKFTKQFRTIKQNSFRLLRLVNNILDLTRIDNGYVKFNPENCNIVLLIEEITQSVLSYAEQKRITLEFSSGIEEITTAVDADKVERILLNLLSNAIKFTGPGGRITVGVNKADDKVSISVKDTGLGIPKEKQEEIFQRFNQVNSPLSRDFEGSGIGLSIVKSFVDLHHGSIRLISEEGRGSEFVVELPIKVYEAAGMNRRQNVNAQSKRVDILHIELSEIDTLISADSPGQQDDKDITADAG